LIGNAKRTATATPDEIANAVAWLVRSEHWNQGSWDASARDGSLYQLVARIRALRDAYPQALPGLTCDRPHRARGSSVAARDFVCQSCAKTAL
jgi:hypothetical protein